MEEASNTSVGLVSAVCFVPRGATKEYVQSVGLSQMEVERILDGCEDTDDDDERSTDESMNEGDSDAKEEQRNNNSEMGNDISEPEDNDEYKFCDYNEERNVNYANLASIVARDDEIIDDVDSEEEDDMVKPTDNLLLVGNFESDVASLEVWVFNSDEVSFYIHHDLSLPSFPLCLEWINYDPEDKNNGNMCAVGSMDPVIDIWDLDILDAVAPVINLGSKPKLGKRQRDRKSHTDAVVSLSWNRNYPHVLASGSVDKTVMLWDLDREMVHASIDEFPDKVQSVTFHPTEAQLLLTGCADNNVRILDCRDASTALENALKWKLSAEVEKVLWNPNDDKYFIMGDNEGSIYYADRRNAKKFLWSYKAHQEEISGICFNKEMPNLLATTSIESVLKIWNFNSTEIKHVCDHDIELGRLQSMDQCPEDNFTLAFGGEKNQRCTVFNIKNLAPVREVFGIPTVE